MESTYTYMRCCAGECFDGGDEVRCVFYVVGFYVFLGKLCVLFPPWLMSALYLAPCSRSDCAVCLVSTADSRAVYDRVFDVATEWKPCV